MSNHSKKNRSQQLAMPLSLCESQAQAIQRMWLILRVLLILLTGLFVFSPTFHGEWLWDDDQEVTANRALKTFSGLWDIWTGSAFADYFPLKSTFLWIQYQLWQLNNTGYHLTTIVFHLSNSLLVWKLFCQLHIRLAWIGGLLFCIHPVVVESVAWVSEQKNTLSQFFLLLSMLACLRFDERHRSKDYCFAVLFFIAAALCKTAVLMLAPIILLYCWWKRKGISKKDILFSAPFFAIALLLGAVTIWFQFKRAIGEEGIPVGGFFSRLATAGMSTVFYVSKSILPVDLMPIYPRWEVDPPTWLQFVPALITLLLLLYFYRKRATWGRDMLFGFGFFLLNLVPVMGFVTMSYMRITWAADHFLYLPIIGLLGLFCSGAGWLYLNASANKQIFLEGVGVGVLLLLSYTSFSYASIFVKEEVMWRYTLKRNPNAWQAHSRYAMTLINKGDLGTAYSHLLVAVKLRPDLAEIRNNLGVILQKWDRMDESLQRFREARERALWEPTYSMNLANALIMTRNYSEAMGIFSHLIKLRPNNAVFYCNYGATLFMLGLRQEAISQFQTALKLNPSLESARSNLRAALSNVSATELQFSR
ncbi:MAG: hypothetical protein C5B47_08395 [Verrucomicrobia bacterium]|nr:MAG: hypothetical protein C5B47_08395 [Verrucomicrobiota bacterium]